MAPNERKRPGAPAGATAAGTLLFLLFAGLGIVVSGLEVLSMLASDPAVFVIAFLLATMTAVPYTALLLWVDRNEAEPPWLLALALAWGALCATGYAGIANSIAGLAFAEALGDTTMAEGLTSVLVAPVTEELTKAVALVAIFTLFRRHADNVLDGLVYGSLVGMGFAWFENILYYVRAADDGIAAMVGLAWLRGVLFGIGMHATYTGITGIAFGLFRVMRRGVMRWMVLPGGLALAMVAHGVWNLFGGMVVGAAPDDASALLLGGPTAVLLLQLPFLALIAITLGLTWQHEDRLIRTELAQEPRDIARVDEIERLVPARRRVAAGWIALRHTGLRGWWRHRQLTRTLIRLAFERWHLQADALPWSPDEDARILSLRQRIRRLRAAGTRV